KRFLVQYKGQVSQSGAWPFFVGINSRVRGRAVRHGLAMPDKRVRLPPDTLGDRLKVGCLALNETMLVRFQLPELTWLGRPLDDHPLSKRGMLWVRLPPEPHHSVSRDPQRRPVPLPCASRVTEM